MPIQQWQHVKIVMKWITMHILDALMYYSPMILFSVNKKTAVNAQMMWITIQKTHTHKGKDVIRAPNEQNLDKRVSSQDAKCIRYQQTALYVCSMWIFLTIIDMSL